MPIVEEEIIALLILLCLHFQNQHQVEPLSKNTVEKSDEAPVFFEISSAADQVPQWHLRWRYQHHLPLKNQSLLPKKKTKKKSSQTKKLAKVPLSSGGYLAKPTKIYVEEQPAISKSNSNEEPLPLQIQLRKTNLLLKCKW